MGTEMVWPTWRPFNRQETALSSNSMSRQETWGLDYQASDDEGAQHVDLNAVMIALHRELAGRSQSHQFASSDAHQVTALEVPPTNTSALAQAPPEAWAGKTTAMMRNLPNRYTQSMLLEELDRAQFSGCYDFVYLPIDPDTRANRGYAFINFSAPEYAWMFKLTFEGHKTSCVTDSRKVVEVTPAALQGFDANYAHYAKARVNRGDPAARPLFLREPSNPAAPATRGSRGGRGHRGRRHKSFIDKAAQEATHVSESVAQQHSSCPDGSMAAPQAAQAASFTVLQAVAVPSQPMLAVPLARFCTSCGGKRRPDFRFCQFCGFRF